MTTARPAPATGLYCELYWGQNLAESWSFGPERARILAASDEGAPLPLYGFQLPEEPFVLAEQVEGRYRVYPAAGMRVERRRAGQGFESAAPTPGPRPYVELGDGEVLRLSEGELALHVQPSVVRERVHGLRVKDYVMLVAGILAFVSLPLAFLAFGPDPQSQVQMAERALQLQRDKDAAKREALGVTAPPRPLTEEELRGEAGDTVVLPTRITVE